jgi:hypothetical protein
VRFGVVRMEGAVCLRAGNGSRRTRVGRRLGVWRVFEVGGNVLDLVQVWEVVGAQGR